jgi:hypothetical protein
MNTLKEAAKKLYEGKYFYEIVRSEDPQRLILVGPRDDIYYVNQVPESDFQEYTFMQVINGTLKQAFKAEEILVTDRVL